MKNKSSNRLDTNSSFSHHLQDFQKAERFDCVENGLNLRPAFSHHLQALQLLDTVAGHEKGNGRSVGMANKLTPKQEAFCLAYMETGNASEAYRQSYSTGNMKPQTIHRKANEVFKNGKVTARLEQHRLAAQERHNVTVDSLTAELEEARDLARAAGQAGAAVAATMGKAKLHGMLVDRKEHSGKIAVERIEREIINLKD